MSTTDSDLRAAAVHEAAHFLCAVHFQCGASPQVFVRGFGPAQTVGGQTRFEYAPRKFTDCVVSWAGVLAEDLIGPRHVARSVPAFPPATHLREWHWSLLGGAMKELSDSDQKGMLAYPRPWRAVKCAFKLLSRDTAKLTELAGLLVDAARKQRQADEEKNPLHWRKQFPSLAEIIDRNEQQRPEQPYE